MKKIINNTHLEGYLYGHDLQLKVTGPDSKNPGTEFISGSLDILTDDAGLNVVPVNFRYVVEKTKAGKVNATYTTLMNIIKSEGKTFPQVGPAAMKLRIDTALGLNDFYNAEGELISYKINDGGFVHPLPAFTSNRNSFEVDMLLTNAIMKEADEEKGTPDMLILKGATFNFMNAILPIELVVKDPAGIKYFEKMDPSSAEPIFLKVWGHMVASTIETQNIEESAFGEEKVQTSTRRLREWIVTGASTEPYEYGAEGVLTKTEVETAVAARETYLADVKRRREEYDARMGNASTASPKVASGGFNF